MGALARFLARQLWWGMLWLMRRPWMKRLQNRSTTIFGPKREVKMRASLHRQNAIARRWGLTLITLMMNLLLASIVITLVYTTALGMYESGLLKGPNPVD
jgi:hypothetical protein